jgi:cell division protein FtsB
MLSKIPKWLRNPYLLIGFVFLIWLVFLDEYRLITQWKLMRKREEMKKEIQQYAYLIDSIRKELKQIQEDSFYIEKYAREHYFFKKPDELVIVLDTVTQ